MRIFILFLLPLVVYANSDKHHWVVKVDHYNVIYLQCGVYSYSTEKIIHHDVGLVNKMVIKTHTDYVKSDKWMEEHVLLNGIKCD